MVRALTEWRETKCYYIYCLQNYVKQGVATVSDCERLESYLLCKYVYGEAWEVFPLAVFWERVMGMLEKAFSSWVSLGRFAVVTLCGGWCLISGSLSGWCNIIYYLLDIVDFLEAFIGTILRIKQELSEGAGTSYCDFVGV
jgi:hypothetical protein